MQVTYTRSAPAQAVPRRLAARIDGPAVAAWTLAFALVTYLALRGGGYDTVVRSEVGVAVWWIVLLGAAAGVLPARVRPAGLVAIGLLAGFAVWTGLAVTWSESTERSVAELGRIGAYLGVLVLAIALQGATAARHTINGLACAIGLVTLIAVLARLQPQLFPANDHFAFLSEDSSRKLSYPLNYWNALAAFAALGVPLLLAVAVGARTLAGQAVAAALLPVSALCVEMTLSRGGALALAIGVIAFLVLAPRRLHTAATLLVSGAGAAILIWGTVQRDALESGRPTPEALAQGDELLVLLVLACLGVGLVQVALGLVARHVARPRALTALTPRRLVGIWAAVAAVALVAGVAAGLPGEAGSQWRDFTAPVGEVVPGSETTVFSRLSAANGNGRYEFWKSAVDANATDPLRGIGPGTFELWWSRNSTTPGFVRDAHTLYFETLAETGVIGFALLGGLFAFLLIGGVVRLLRARPALRLWLAAALAAVASFMTSAALEWVWELAAIAAAALVLAAVIVAGREEAPSSEQAPAVPTRLGLVLLAIGALAAVAIPLAGALALRDSQAAAADGRLVAALEGARTAERVQPYAASAHLQRALVLEQAGALEPAVAAVRAAAAEESTNWRTWVVLARLEARRGATAEALEAFQRAKRLNPKSNLFMVR